MVKKVVLWILVITCMGLIFFFSSQEAPDSRETSSAFIYNIVSFLDVRNTLSEVQIHGICDLLHKFVRTAAHFTIFGLLGFLLLLLFGEYGLSSKRRLIYTVIVAFLYACSDEIHQSFVPGRSAQISDIIVDTLGALCGGVVGNILLYLIKKLKGKSHGML